MHQAGRSLGDFIVHSILRLIDRLDYLGFISQPGQEVFLFSKMFRPAVGPTQPPVPCVCGAVPLTPCVPLLCGHGQF